MTVKYKLRVASPIVLEGFEIEADVEGKDVVSTMLQMRAFGEGFNNMDALIAQAAHQKQQEQAATPDD